MHSPILTLIVLSVLQPLSGVKCENVFQHCIKVSKKPNIIECAGQQAIHALQLIENTQNFTIARGLVAIRDDVAAARSIPNLLEQDPMDFRGLLENAGAVIGQRSLQWDMSRLYPGLSLRVGPTTGPGSVLEFVMDPEQQVDERVYLGDEPSTARVLTKKFLLPFLLGLKFNLVAIVPLIFAGIILLCKKAAFLAKIAFFLMSVFGFGGALSIGALAGGDYGHIGHHSPVRPGYGLFEEPPLHHHHHAGSGYYRNDRNVRYEQPREEEYPTPSPDRFYNYEKKVLLQDRKSKLYEKGLDDIKEEASDTSKTYRSFAWKTV